MWDKCETEYITYEWDSLCELGKKEEEESLLIGNQARLNIFQWEIANELKYLQTKNRDSALFQAFSSSYYEVPTNSIHSVLSWLLEVSG